MSRPLKASQIVFVHGLFGWGPGELGGAPYWGEAMEAIGDGFGRHEAKVGPLSSFHDRACELFAQLAGGTVDYGEAHSAAAGHARFGQSFAPFFDGWSAENPVILIGHSAGAQTCLQLQALLAADFWGRGTTADWVEVVVSVAGVINGSLLTYKFGCDKLSGRLTGVPGQLIEKALNLVGLIAGVPTGMRRPIALWLDHWAEGGPPLDHGPFVEGEDNLGFDLTLQGCLKANAAFRTNPDTYYFSLVTDATKWGGLFGLPWPGGGYSPDRTINPLLFHAALFQAREVDFDAPPIAGWGAGDMVLAEWRRNDGAVSAISQTRPFTARPEPVGGGDVFARGPALERGRWNVEDLHKATGQRFDHFDPVIGARLKPWMHGPHREIYARLGETLRSLK